MTTIDLFLEELKSQYKQEFELKSTLENKANYLLIAAGVTMTLLFSFSPTIFTYVKPDYQYFHYVIIFLFIGILSNGLSVLFSVLAFAIKPYRYAMTHDIFFNKTGDFNYSKIKEYRDGEGKDKEESEKIFKETIIETYLRCNRNNGKQNSTKAIKVQIAQWFFFSGMIFIPLILFFILHYTLRISGS